MKFRKEWIPEVPIMDNVAFFASFSDASGLKIKAICFAKGIL